MVPSEEQGEFDCMCDHICTFWRRWEVWYERGWPSKITDVTLRPVFCQYLIHMIGPFGRCTTLCSAQTDILYLCLWFSLAMCQVYVLRYTSASSYTARHALSLTLTLGRQPTRNT